MTIKYKNVPQVFALKTFCMDAMKEIDAIKVASGMTSQEISVLCFDRSETFVSTIAHHARHGSDVDENSETSQFSLRRILHIANTLGMDVRRYILLKK